MLRLSVRISQEGTWKRNMTTYTLTTECDQKYILATAYKPGTVVTQYLSVEVNFLKFTYQLAKMV